MSKQVITFHTGSAFGSTNWQTAVGGSSAFAANGNPVGVLNIPWAVAGVFRDFFVRVEVAPGVGASWVGTVYKGTGTGAPSSTGITITISDAALTAQSTSGNISISPGDYLRIQWVGSGSPASPVRVTYTCVFEPTTEGESGYCGYSADYFPTIGSGKGYTSPFWPTYTTSSRDRWNHETSGFGAALKEELATTIRTAGSLTGLYILTHPVIAAGSYIFTLWKALEASPGTFVKQDGSGGTVDTRVTVGIGAQTGNSTFDLPLEVGDRVVLEVEASGTTTNIQCSWATRYKATNETESILGGWFADQLASADRWISPNGQAVSTTVSGDKAKYTGIAHPVESFDINNLFIRLDTPVGNTSGGSPTRIFTIHKNGSATSLVVTIGVGQSIGSATGAVTIDPGDTWQLVHTFTGTPTGNPQFEWAFLEKIGNARPIVDAGPDQVVIIPTTNAQLAGSATDDGLPEDPGALTYLWTQISGPAPVTFADETDPATMVTFIPAIGTYVLQLAAFDGELTGTNTMTITLQEALDAEDCPSGAWGITVNGVDKTSYLKLEEVSIEYTLGSPGVLECLIIDTGDPATAFRPAVGDVIIVTKGVRIFTGKIVTTEEEPLVDTNTGTGTRISANDYQRAIARRFFTKNYDPYSYATEPPSDGQCAMTTERVVVSIADFFGTNSVVTAYPHLLTTGDRVTFVGVVGASPEVNDEQFEVTVTGDDTFTIPGTPLTTPGAGGKVVKLVQTNEIFDDLLPFLAAYGITVNVETPGPWIIAPNFTRATIEDVVNYISRLADWVYRMTPYKVLQAFSPGAIVAPFELNSDNATVIGNVTNRRTREDYANALYVTGGKVGGQRVEFNRRETWIGDGSTVIFPLADPDSWTIGNNCTHPGVIYIDGVSGPLTGLYPDDIGRVDLEYLFSLEDKFIYVNTEGGWSIPVAGTIIEFAYTGPENFTVYVTDPVAIAANNGEIEEDTFEAGEDATPATARALGIKALAKQTVTQREAVVRTDVCLVLPGTLVSVDLPSRLMSGDWMVTAVSAEDSEARDLDGAAKAYYTYTLLEAGVATTFIDYWKRLVG